MYQCLNSMELLTDAQAELVKGGGISLFSGPKTSVTTNLNVAPKIAILPQISVGVNTALLGSNIDLNQFTIGGIGVA